MVWPPVKASNSLPFIFWMPVTLVVFCSSNVLCFLGLNHSSFLFAWWTLITLSSQASLPEGSLLRCLSFPLGCRLNRGNDHICFCLIIFCLIKKRCITIKNVKTVDYTIRNSFLLSRSFKQFYFTLSTSNVNMTNKIYSHLYSMAFKRKYLSPRA